MIIYFFGQINLLPAQPNADGQIIKIDKPGEEPKFKVELVGNAISTKDIRKGKMQRIEIICKGQKVFSDEVHRWSSKYAFAGGGRLNFLHVVGKNNENIFFNENGKLPIPGDLEISDMSGVVHSSYLQDQNYFWVLKRGSDNKSLEYRLYDFSCRPFTDFFRPGDFEYSVYNNLIIKKDGLKTLILSGQSKPLLTAKNVDYVRADYAYKTAAQFFITDTNNVEIYNIETGEKLNGFKINKVYTSIVLTDRWLMPYQIGDKIGLFSLRDLAFIPANYDGVSNMSAKYYFLARNKEKKYALCDWQGNIRSAFEYENYLEDLSEKNICLQKNNRKGVLDSTGKVIMKFEYYSIASELCWNSYLEQFIKSPCLKVKKDSTGKIALFNRNGGMMSPYKYDEVSHDKRSNYFIATAGGTKEYFYIDGSPINKNEAESNIYKSYIDGYNVAQKATAERLNRFTAKWNEIVDKTSITGYYADEKKNLFNVERTAVIKEYEKLLYKNNEMLNNINAKLTPSNRESIESNIKSINNTLSLLRNMPYDFKFTLKADK